MKYLSRTQLPPFTERMDLTATELNQQADVLVTAINELAGRIYIIKERIKKDERGQYAEEINYPILDEMDRLAKELSRAFIEIKENKNYAHEHIETLYNKFLIFERRLNALDDRVALKSELNALIERVNYVRDHSLPSVGPDNNWYVGDINTGVAATGNSGVYMGNTEPTDPAVGVWIDTSDETTIAVAEEVSF